VPCQNAGTTPPATVLTMNSLTSSVLVGLDQLLDPRLVLVLFAHGDQAGIGTVLVLDQDAVARRVEAGLVGIVSVDGRGIGVVERARQLGSLDLGEAELPGVLDDVARRGVDAGDRVGCRS